MRKIKPAPALDVMRLDPEQFLKTQWLWHPFLPKGNATMLYGPGGHGKSTITIDLAARASKGENFPGEHGNVKHTPKNILFMSAEDDVYEVLGPRFHAAGGDLERAFFLPESLTISPEEVVRIKETIARFAIDLVVIDPVVSYFGAGLDMNRMNQVRAFVGGLQAMAREMGIVVLLVHHARKSNGEGHNYEAAAGSVDFINGVRSAVQIRKDNEGDFIFEHVKANLGPMHDPIKYELRDGTINWGMTVKSGARQGERKMNTGPSVKAAREFILTALKNGPRPATFIVPEAEAVGINLKALNRAKPGIAESFPKRGEDGKMRWFWKLTKEGDEANGTSIPGMGKRLAPVDPGLDWGSGKDAGDPGKRGTVVRARPKVGSGGLPPAASGAHQTVADWLAAQGLTE